MINSLRCALDTEREELIRLTDCKELKVEPTGQATRP
jgi:hypothetical protein